ncbi:hypothetical protein LXA43DRAFT_1002796 [Ganoderma leucocontextum]|nr:hypothetical protein LXA43DRAFT_1002796 [Ganoderma leucocontextum]
MTIPVAPFGTDLSAPSQTAVSSVQVREASAEGNIDGGDGAPAERCVLTVLGAQDSTALYAKQEQETLPTNASTHVGDRSSPGSTNEIVSKNWVDEVSDDASEDDEEIPRIPASGNIRDDLATLLEDDLEFTGEFSFHRAYSTAPNPSLNIDDLGTIGLPLSPRDAAAIKFSSDQAPFGMADRTLVDKSVRDTWEIDGKRVQFENPAWQSFLDDTVRDVCQVLGVNFEASHPRCDLYKLLLYEAGSHTEKADGMFATIVVVLPSRFTGGAVCVSHGDISKHAVKQVTSGYRLALSFNLIHTTSSLRPAVRECSITSELRHILLSWKEAEGNEETPKKIIRLLDHKYSEANLSGSALKGPDAHLIALLENVATPLGFCLGLANLNFTQRGYGMESGGYGRRRRRYGYNSEPEDSDVEMTDLVSEVVDIEHLVDLDGDWIQGSLEYKLEEVIPDGLEAGSLERFYRRTVLVIWPESAHFDLLHGSKAFAFACAQLSASTSQDPTEEEAELANIVLARSNASRAKDVVSSVCRVALTWKDFSLWFRGVRACDAETSIGTLQADNILRAVATFGFDEIQPCLERTVERDPSNTRVLKFLDRFEEWVASQGSAELAALTASWFEIVRENRLDDVKSVAHDKPDVLLTTVLKYRGADFLEQTIFPLVKQCSNCVLLLSYAVTLYGEGGIPAESRVCMAKAILRDCLSKLDFYPAIRRKRPSNHRATYGREPSDESQQLEKARPYLKACIVLDCAELFPIAVQKLLALDDLAEDLVYRRVKHVLLPLVAYVGELARSRPGCQPVPDLRKLCEEAVSLSLRNFATNPWSLTQTDVSSLVQVAVEGGQPDLVLTWITPKLEALDLKDTQLREIVEGLHAKRAVIDPAGTNLNPNWIGTTSLTTQALPMYHAYGTSSANRAKPAVDALDFCLKTQLAPLLPDIRGLLLKHKQPLTSPLFVSAFRTIMLYWAEKVLGPRPPNTASKHLEADPQLAVLMRRVSRCPQISYRGHIEKFLQSHARAIATYSTIRTTPQGLKVTKLPAIVAPARWVEHQKQGLDMLKSISADPAEIQAILGPKHAEVSALLQGRGPVGATKSATFSNVPSGALSAAVAPQPFDSLNVAAAVAASSNQSKKLSTAGTIHGNWQQQSAQAQGERTSSLAALPASSRLDTGPPAKRRKTTYDEKDVIDLT